ncbi:MAG: hypothetical protein GX434_12815 [Peptococcaceae bacterium]|nr:hypothetical protein [Peptococcaceae bacterium]
MARKMKNSGIEWIKQVPIEWKTLRGKNILNLMNRPFSAGDGVITCFRDGEVTLRSNRREDGYTFSDKEIGYQGIKYGDLVIHGMDGFAGAIGISDSDGKGSPVLIVCTPKGNIYLKYIMYYLRMLSSQNVFTALATGIRERSCDLRWNKIANLLFPVPSTQEQLAIVDYLDRKCSQIDDNIEKQKTVIEKLLLYKQSVITETVTMGIDKKIDNNWREEKLGKIALYKKGPFGSDITISMFVPKSQGSIKVYEQKNAIYKDATLGESYINMETFHRLKSFEVFPGDIIVSCAGTIGECFILPDNMEKGIINQALMKISLNTDMNKSFFLYLFDVILKELSARYSNGSAMKNIPSFEILKKHKIRVPNIKRQDEIVEYLNNKR